MKAFWTFREDFEVKKLHGNLPFLRQEKVHGSFLKYLRDRVNIANSQEIKKTLNFNENKEKLSNIALEMCSFQLILTIPKLCCKWKAFVRIVNGNL